MSRIHITETSILACMAAMLSLATLSGCAVNDGSAGAGEPEAVGLAEQGWYSHNPYDQHDEMTYNAIIWSDYYGIDWDINRDCYTTHCDYTGQVADGNSGADHSDNDENKAFFIAFWGNDRANSQNHHFLRDGTETLDSACGNSVADLYKGTLKALEWRAQGNEANFQRGVGAITHAIQDSFAPAHARRDAVQIALFTDLCSIHVDVPGACRHPETSDPLSKWFPITEDDADDNEDLASLATRATQEYLIAVAKVATKKAPNALAVFIQKWFKCPPLLWLPAVGPQ